MNTLLVGLIACLSFQAPGPARIGTEVVERAPDSVQGVASPPGPNQPSILPTVEMVFHGAGRGRAVLFKAHSEPYLIGGPSLRFRPPSATKDDEGQEIGIVELRAFKEGRGVRVMVFAVRATPEETERLLDDAARLLDAESHYLGSEFVPLDEQVTVRSLRALGIDVEVRVFAPRP